MPVTHYVKTKSGDTYTDQGGTEKENYVTIGRMIENSRGNKVIVLDCIPFAWLAGGKPVAMFLQPYEPKERTGTPTPAPAKPVQTNLDEDIPFMVGPAL